MITKQLDIQVEELIPSEELTVHLHWDATTDLDIFAIYEDQDGQKGLIYFAESGSKKEYPFIELLFAFEFSEIPVDNQEIIAIGQMNMQKIWIFGWDFDAVQEGVLTDFQEQKVYLEIRCQDKIFLTRSEDLGKGNLAVMGCFYRGASKQLVFSNYSEMKEVAIPDQMEDLLQILS